jgi:ubiquinone/menaquinone biosynthesis C-methylase UbiE
MAWSYDFVSAVVSVGMWKEWVLSLVSGLPGPRILEIGHGPGHLQKKLLSDGITTFGLDFSSEMIKIANKNIQRIGLEPNLVNGLAQNLPFLEGYFDQVVTTFPTEFIVDPNSVKEIHRVLKHGGNLLILPVAWITGNNLFEKTAAWLFQVTGQANPPEDYHLKIFESMNFRTRVEYRFVRKSKLLIIHATKQ